ncbi:MAG: outer membrane protein assembly factor BamA [Pseudomonadota bacterium]
MTTHKFTRHSAIRNIGITIFLLCIGFACTALGEEQVTVGVLPFDIYAAPSMQMLRTRLPALIEDQLARAGILIQKQTDITADEWCLSEKMSGASFVVSGSFTQSGDHFSIDARVSSCRQPAKADRFFVEGIGIEHLLEKVQQLSQLILNKALGRVEIAKIIVVGNRLIELEAIKGAIHAKEGNIFSEKELRDDLKLVYQMGYFDDVSIEASDVSAGKQVMIRVVERPVIHEIIFKGNSELKEEKLKETLNIKAGSILNIYKTREAVSALEQLYKKEGYHYASVKLETKLFKYGQSDLIFNIEEGEELHIKEISFIGNTAYSSKDLRDLMKTSEKGFFSWLTSSGSLEQEKLDQDISILATHYHNNGYLHAKIGEPEISYEKEWIYITIKIEEGTQFKISEVTVEGDMIEPEEKLRSLIKIKSKDTYSRAAIREDVLALLDVCTDAGYAYADVSPRIDENPEKQEVKVAYVIKKGKPVYFEKIIINGNTKTRDKVIRRELRVYEQELFSGKGMKQGIRNIHRLDYFEDVKVNNVRGSSDDKMVLQVDVKEKATGAFTFGGGYSSVDHVFGMASIAQRNLFGRGQTLELKATASKRTTDFNLGFTEPWLFDIPLLGGFDLYNIKKDYDTYDKDSIGGKLRLGYRLTDYTRTWISYNYEQADVRNIQDNAAKAVKEMEGETISSSVTTGVGRDSRDKVFNPTEGSDNSISVEWAGGPFGGDTAFAKYIADTGWYYPLFWGTVAALHGELGFVTKNSGGKLPVYERFMLGGMNSVRGFDYRDIGPKDPDTYDPTGGNKMIQFNAEYLVPIIKDAGLMGLLFFDAGQAYDNGENITLNETRKSVGYGIRWYSPMGPLRLEYGHILDPLPGEGTGRWEFSMGTLF